MMDHFGLRVVLCVSALLLPARTIAFGTGAPGDSEGKGPAHAAVAGWGEVTDPDGDCRIASPAEAQLEIEVPGSAHDVAAELKRWNAPRVLSDVSGDLVAQVKVAGAFQPDAPSTIANRRPYHGAGLLLWKDKDNYVSLHRAAVRVGDQVHHYVNFEQRKDGRLAISFGQLQIPDKDVILRLERRGGHFYAYASNSDGVSWASYKPIKDDLPDSLKLGVVAVSSATSPLKVTFQHLEVFLKRHTHGVVGAAPVDGLNSGAARADGRSVIRDARIPQVRSEERS